VTLGTSNASHLSDRRDRPLLSCWRGAGASRGGGQDTRIAVSAALGSGAKDAAPFVPERQSGVRSRALLLLPSRAFRPTTLQARECLQRRAWSMQIGFRAHALCGAQSEGRCERAEHTCIPRALVNAGGPGGQSQDWSGACVASVYTPAAARALSAAITAATVALAIVDVLIGTIPRAVTVVETGPQAENHLSALAELASQSSRPCSSGFAKLLVICFWRR
jgi:hypothetical protein